MSNQFELGETKVVSGKVTTDKKFTGRLMMSSPDVVAPLADLDKVSCVSRVACLSKGPHNLGETSSKIVWNNARLTCKRFNPETQY